MRGFHGKMLAAERDVGKRTQPFELFPASGSSRMTMPKPPGTQSRMPPPRSSSDRAGEGRATRLEFFAGSGAAPNEELLIVDECKPGLAGPGGCRVRDHGVVPDILTLPNRCRRAAHGRHCVRRPAGPMITVALDNLRRQSCMRWRAPIGVSGDGADPQRAAEFGEHFRAAPAGYRAPRARIRGPA
jgi:hypothetical protein